MVINGSLWEGVVVQLLKGALVQSLVKRSSLDSILLDNFHPVCNLSFLGKIVEEGDIWQLYMFLNEMNYMDLFQLKF